ncbi:hypothetical protein BDU57DRAFT_562401 [Ampelomyces quisqualis]|uniref:Uncharacterized protein n=1 Tax=Ampelomyces quisqualis TaxID=50730 RepID=A0A6A5R0I3_AMPQU|nr:hypothetical protein BDU57DRAFT_562401 [Ampelomyces quisqualis]
MLAEVSHIYSLDQVVVKDRHPKSFFQDIECAFRDITAGFVLPKHAQRKIIHYLKSVTLPHVELHCNPANSAIYRSSSYDAVQQRFNPPAGGYGPPQSVNGSFCHSHTDSSFVKMHPNVDLDTYNAPKRPSESSSKRERKQRSENIQSTKLCTRSPAASFNGSPAGPIPAIKVTKATADIFFQHQDNSSSTIEQSVVNVETEDDSQSTIATNSQALINDEQRSSSALSVATDNLNPNGSSTTAVDVNSYNDEAPLENSGIVLEDTSISDTEDVDHNTQLTAKDQVNSQHATQDMLDPQQALMNAYNRISSNNPYSPGDSAYGTQDRRQSQPSPIPDYGNLSLTGDPLSSYDTAAKQACERKKFTPKSPAAARRSTRISARPQTDAAPAPTSSSLGKRANDDADSDLQELSNKRNKSQS